MKPGSRELKVPANIIVIIVSFFLFASSLFANAYLSSGYTQPVFNTPINLSNDSGRAQFPDVVNVGIHVYAAWTEGSRGIFFRASSNGGSTWAPPLSSSALRISPTGGTTQYPVMSANGSDVYVAWSQTVGTTGLQVFEATSTNYGLSFTAGQVTSGTSSNGFITPVVASWGSNVYIVYSGNGKNSYVVSSNNYGATWRAPYRYAVTFEPEVAVMGSNAYAVADGIQFAVTHNAGASWTQVLTQRYNGDEPMIAVSGTHVYIVAQSRTANGHIWLISSSNNGNSFGARKVVSGSVPNDWAPMVGAYGNSVWAAWHNNPGGSASQEWVTTSTNTGSSWSAPLSIGGTGHWVGWPFQVSTTDGKNVFIVWPQQVTSSPNYWVVRASYSGDGGATWSAPPGISVSQNSNGQAAPENDIANAAISTYGSRAFAVWQFISTSGTNQIYFTSS